MVSVDFIDWFLALLVSASVRALPATFVLPWQQSFGWSRGTESAVIATGTLLFGLIGPFSAAFLQRYGARKVGSIVLLILVAVTAALPLMQQVWQAELLVGLLSGTMTGMIADVYGIYIANNWFSKNHGLVLGLFTASSSVGQLIVLPIFTMLIAQHGWRFTALVVAGCVLVVFFANLFLMRDYPKQVGLPVLGETKLRTPQYPALNLRSVLMQPLQALHMALKSKIFWLLALPFLYVAHQLPG
ncbi:hypothetical protein ATO00_01690 [Loigolactobacillus coryniformis subsp. coryniformis]|nr:hypothetical protein ATO00_01690 [Loigolactobacillus coryniformis subsp. coryniformis]